MRIFTGLVLGLMLAGAAQGQEPPGDPAAGKKTAEFLCRNCHDVTGNEEPKNPPGDAPAFYTLAQRPDVTFEHLHGYLLLPHGKMTNVLLTGKEIDNVAAYILGMKHK